MDALSAVKGLMAPDVAGRIAAAEGAAPAASTIPASDLAKLESTTLQPNAASSTSPSFANLLTDMVGDVSQKQTAANTAINGLLSGQNVPLHQAVIAMEEANVSFQLMLEVRNKLLDAYQEIMKMQV